MEYEMAGQVQVTETKQERKFTTATDEKKFGLFGRLLETGKKFIKDDIKDEDFLK